MKSHYTIVSDGPYSGIRYCDCDGRHIDNDPRFAIDGELASCFTSLRKAKARLIEDHMSIIHMYKDAIVEVRSLRKDDIDF